MLFDDKRFLCWGIMTVIVIGIALRLVLGYLLTYNYDVYHWALTISNFQAGNGLYDVAGYYYTPVWGYILGVFAQFTDLFGIDLLGERFTDLLYTEDYINFYRNSAFVTTLGFNVALTLLITVFDLINAYLVFWIVREVFNDPVKAKRCFTIWFLCAFVITVGAAGGMFDTISATLVLLCVATLIKGQEFLAGAMFATAVLLKFFPVFLIFILPAYLLVRHREDWKPRLMKAVCGGILLAAVIMLPQILDGHVMDSFSFLSARASASDGFFDILMKYDGLIVYPIILIVEFLIARDFFKKEHYHVDRSFIWYAFISMALVFLNPSSPQYLLVLAPLLIIAMECLERELVIPFAILSIGTSLFVLSPIVMDLTSITLYGGLISFESWTGMFEAFETTVAGMSATDAWMVVSAIIQYIGIVAIAVIAVRKHLSERPRAENGEKETSR